MRHRLLVMLVLCSLFLPQLTGIAIAQTGITATNDKATLEFPDWIMFSVDLKSESDINRVVLEYGVQQMTCGTVVGKAFPKFTAGKSLNAKWTWEMKQSGSLPPGATIWWRWRVATAGGKEIVTEQKTIQWFDTWRAWQTVSGKQVKLHWYSGNKAFATELLDAADKSLNTLADTIGLKADEPIDLYIYANTNDLREAVLYEPGWVGGLAFPQHNDVIIAIGTTQMAWGKRSVAHELTHVLVGRYTFSCLGDEPTWLSEGVAMYGEGGPEPQQLDQFKLALAANKLISVRTLSASFPEARDKVDLSYTQSYSLVNFLITEYGKDKLLTLLRALRDGTPLDDAMKKIYGFDVDGFEDAWRAKIGARPRSAAGLKVATSTPTIVPTFAPVQGVVTPSPIPTQTSTPEPATATPAPTETPMPQAAPAPGILSLPIMPIVIGAVVVIMVIVAILIVVRRQKR